MNHDPAQEFVRDSTLNPYALVREADLKDNPRGASDVLSASVAKTVLMWTFVCSLSAAPSFFFAFTSMAKNQVIAMMVGVIVFIGIYTAGDLVTRNLPARKNARIRSILRATFIVRSVMVVIFPLAVSTDLVLGMISVGIVSHISKPMNADNFENQMGFVATLATTLIQGCLLSVLLFLLGLLIAGLVFVIRSLTSRLTQ